MFAIVDINGRQYMVSPGDTILSERLDGAPGTALSFSKVLLFQDDTKVDIGTPFVSGLAVQASIVEQGKADKVITIKMIPKKRHTRHKGHRQQYTKLSIVHIGPPGSTPTLQPKATKISVKKQRAGASKTVKGTPTETEVS